MNAIRGEKTEQMLNRTEKIYQEYAIGQLIGRGTYGEVRVCQNIFSKQIRALRVLEKKKLGEFAKRQFMTEIDLLLYLDHPSILRLIELFQDQKNYYTITELCMGGNLY